MTNDELAQQVQTLNKKVDTLSETVDSLSKTVDGLVKGVDILAKNMAEGFKRVDERFEQVDKRFTQIDARFEQVDEQLTAIRQDHKNLEDIVKDFRLETEVRFSGLEAGQQEIHADIASLRRDLFHEEGARETADDAIHDHQEKRYRALDKRLRLVEAKFPDLASNRAA